jgi:hypothetical protein
MRMGKAKLWFVGAGCFVLLVSAVLFYCWLTYEPPIGDLLARVPPLPHIVATNDSSEVFLSLAKIDVGTTKPDVYFIYEALEKLPDIAARRAYLKEHRAEVQRACAARGPKLEVLYRLAAYDEVFDPPLIEDKLWLDQNQAKFDVPYNTEIKAQILLSELALMENDRRELGRLVDIFAMQIYWRKNQWYPLHIIRGLAATECIEKYLNELLDGGELRPEEAERVRAAMSGARPVQALFRSFYMYEMRKLTDLLLYSDSHHDAPWGRPLHGFAALEMRMGVLNPKLSLHEVLTNELAVIDLMDAGKYAQADQCNREWLRRVGTYSMLRNRAGYAIIRLFTSTISLDGGVTIDKGESAFLARLEAFLREHPATPLPAAAH